MRASPWPRPRVRPVGAARPALRALLIAAFVQGCATEKVTQVVVVSVTVVPGNAAIEPGGTVDFEAVVADEAGGAQVGVPVVWSSDPPDVVFVDQSGTAHALSTGVATVEATYQGVTGAASVLVVPGPTLVMDPDVVSMAGDVEGDGPPTEAVLISNGGLGRLTGLSSEVRYESGGGNDWLGASLSGDATPATLTLSPDIEGMRAGVYDAVVVVTSGDGDDLSASLPVRLSLAGITVRHTGGRTSVEESGSADAFSVVLDLDPGAEMSLSVSAEDPDEIEVSPSRLTFDPTDWSTPRTVTVTAVDDRVVNGDRSTRVVVAVEGGEQTPYAVVSARRLDVAIVDDDVAGFLVSETQGWTSAGENGHNDSLFVVLTAAPLSDVVFSARTDDESDAALSPDELTFTPLDWDDPKLLVFSAVDDNRRDGFGFRTVTIAVDRSRSDPAFHGLSRTVDAVTFDDDRSRDSDSGPGG